MTGIFKAGEVKKPASGVYQAGEKKLPANFKKLGRCKRCQGTDLDLNKNEVCYNCQLNKGKVEKDDDGTIYDMQ